LLERGDGGDWPTEVDVMVASCASSTAGAAHILVIEHVMRAVMALAARVVS
jgi:ABC-type branched-subunit amino acid transport system ATPase component